MTDIDWAHRDMMLGWARLAAQGHDGAKAVVAYHGIPLPAITPLPSAPKPPSVTASVPRAPRASAPATPVSSAIQGRVDALTRLTNPPAVPKGLLD
jgi:hypothetical protein